jgi:hypothetical protein
MEKKMVKIAIITAVILLLTNLLMYILGNRREEAGSSISKQ